MLALTTFIINYSLFTINYSVILALFIAFIIKYHEIDINTATSDQIIHFFAFLVFSSSHEERIYITQAHISAITATTATYFISSATILQIKFTDTSLSFQHLGNQVHSISGQLAANDTKYELSHTNKKINFFIYFILVGYIV